MTERTWIPFTAAHQAQPGRRMRGWHENPTDVWTVSERRAAKSLADAERVARSEVIYFTNGHWIGVYQAKAAGWEIEG